MTRSGPVVARLLAQARSGDRAALDELMPVVYRELRQLARRHLLRQSPGHTLQTTDLVNEAYLKLANVQRMDWKDRFHFLSVASRAMRFVLVDHARKRGYAKRGGNAVKVSLDDALVVSEQQGAEVLAIDEALNRLAALDPRKCQIVELRYFGGLSIDEAAKVLAISTATLNREWAKARAWLYDELLQGQAQ
jgi:RNA polymerase sigma factor (TIGR02999 family)